jgi:hypothetical protein
VSNPKPDEEITLDASGSDAPAGEVASYDWSIEYPSGGSTYETSKSGESVDYAWEQHGEYDVELTVTDNGGKTDTITKTITVGDGDVDTDENENTGEENQQENIEQESKQDTQDTLQTERTEIPDQEPTANFDYSPKNPSTKDRIVFDPSTSEAVGSRIISYRWFINGNPAYRGEELDTNFDEPAVYIVELEVRDTAGNTDRISKSIAVGDKEDRVDNPNFTLERRSPESKQLEKNKGESVGFTAEIDADKIPEATKSLFVDGSLVSQSEVDSSDLRSTYQFEEYGEHTVQMEVKGVAGKSDTLQWDVTTHPFNSVPIAAEQSSTEQLDTKSEVEILTFSVENPSVNEREITSQLVTQLPDGVSVSGTAGASAATSAIQTANETISPGQQESMRLSISVEDDSLQGETIRVPYQIRYHPSNNNSVVYTNNEGSLAVQVGNDESQNGTSDSSPGFGSGITVLSLVLAVAVAKIKLS